MSIQAPILATSSSLWPAIGLPAAAVLGALATAIVARIHEATNRRRDRYAEAVQTLVAWAEFPYRVRRRTGDDPGTLTALASLGHDIQERLASHQAWISTEHPALASAYAETRAILNEHVRPLISEAWECRPIADASDMNLRSWGTGEKSREAISNLQKQIQNRFGIRWPSTLGSRRPKSDGDRINSDAEPLPEVTALERPAFRWIRSISG